MTERTLRRRSLLRATGGGLLGAALVTAAGPARAQDGPSPPEDADEVLAAMDGDGSADDPYVVTDVRELQAVGGALEAHVELGADVDASASAGWNETRSIAGDRLGSATTGEYELSYGPVRPTSETLTVGEPPDDDPRELDDDEYTIDYETGAVELADPHDEHGEYVWADYELQEATTKGFDPIGTPDTAFAGRFDGRGYEIRGLTVYRPDDRAGLVRNLLPHDDHPGEIANVRLTDVDVVGAGGVGALLGAKNDGVVRNVAATGRVRQLSHTGVTPDLGGIVGSHWGGEVRNCRADVTISGGDYAGGVVGTIWEGELHECYATGDVDGGRKSGGFAGRNSGLVRRCYATGSVAGDWNTGGLVGSNYGGRIDESYATGDVAGHRNVGGLAGGLLREAVVEASYATGAVTGENGVGGLVGEVDDDGTVTTSFATGGVTSDGDRGGLVGRLGNLSVEAGQTVELRESYWDRATTGCDDAVGSRESGNGQVIVDDVQGLPSGELRGGSAADALPALDFDGTWRTVEDPADYPTHRGEVVAGIRPRVVLDVGATTVPPGESVTFDAAGSGPAERIERYEWDVTGDGEVDATGPEVGHAYDEPGEYEVTLTVVDDAGGAATATQSVVVDGDGGASGGGGQAADSDASGGGAGSADDDGPGFTVGGAVAGLGGAVYVLRRRIGDDRLP